MTSLYGSKAIPREIFGTGEQLRVFYKVMEMLAPAAWDLNELFLEMWDPTAMSNDWILPDNFHVHIKVMNLLQETVQLFNEPIKLTRKINAPKDKGRSLGANVIHSIDGMVVREITRRCDYDPMRIHQIKEILEGDELTFIFADAKEKANAHKMTGILWDHYKKSGYLSARILDYIDSDSIEMTNRSIIKELIDSLPVKPFKVISTHDCFRSLPNYMNDVRKQYNLQLYLISQSNLLSFLLAQISGREMQIGKLGIISGQDILNSNYALS